MRVPPPALNVLLDEAAAHYAAARLDAAEVAYRGAESRAPDDGRATYSLAVIDLRRQRFAEARRRLRAFVRRHPENASAQHNLGVAEQALGAWEAAARAYDQAVLSNPRAGGTRLNLAIALAVVGRSDEAIHHYRILAADAASRPGALTRLAVLRPGALTDEELSQLRRAADDPRLPEQTRVGALFAASATLEARGNEAEGFDLLVAANDLKHGMLDRGPPEHRPAVVAGDHQRSIERVRTLFTADFLADHAGEGDEAARPIFILGMPRSGSTLIEQILASHPQVQGMGESDALSAAVANAFPYPPEAAKGPGHFRGLGRRYLQAQRERGWTGRGRLTDKTLDNHLHVGLIHLMFPKAVFLHAARDPMDAGLACYRQLFASGGETLYSLAEIGAEWRRYQAMMEHWRAVLPGRVIDVRYEALVAAPDSEIRRLVTQTCGLSWSKDCLRFHETRRAVGTASADAVRRPIFHSSMGRWRRYENRLGELAAALVP
jgi:hypothetical protein